MSYSNTRLRLITGDLESGVAKLWSYTTAADADATIVGSGYFSDAIKFGMAVGDIVDVVATTGPKYKRYQVASVSGTTFAATVAAPTVIT